MLENCALKEKTQIVDHHAIPQLICSQMHNVQTSVQSHMQEQDAHWQQKVDQMNRQHANELRKVHRSLQSSLNCHENTSYMCMALVGIAFQIV